MRHCFFSHSLANSLASATSTDVEQVFSRGWLILPHIRNCLSAASTRALLCLGMCSLAGLVKDRDVTKDESDGGDESEDNDDWEQDVQWSCNDP